MEKQTRNLTDRLIDGAIDFAQGKPMLIRDGGGGDSVKGLQIRLGKHKHAWQFYSERSDHGKRV